MSSSAVTRIRTFLGIARLLLLAVLAACGGGGSAEPSTLVTYVIGGSVSGLTEKGLVLTNNGMESLTVDAVGAFSFPTKVASGKSYAVAVLTQPPHQHCSVDNGTGTAKADVSSVAVVCTTLPEQPVVNVTYGVKRVILTWGPAAGATYYEVRKTLGSERSVLGTKISTTTFSESVAVHLTDWLNTRYIVAACNVGGCTDSLPIQASSQLAIGHFSNSVASVGDAFGASVAISADGTTLAIGDPGESGGSTGINGDVTNQSAFQSGAAFVYVYDGIAWSRQAYIKASNTGAGDGFGGGVALSDDGNRLVVSAPNEDSAATGPNGNESDGVSTDESGAVYVFDRNQGTWSQQAYIKASNTHRLDQFGWKVSLSGNGHTLAVGAPGESSNASGINGNQNDTSALGTGAVYLFQESSGIWSQQAYIKASNANAQMEFGFSVALSESGDVLAVAGPRDDSDSEGINGDQMNQRATESGAVFVFTRQNAAWSQQAYIKASNPRPITLFGNSIDLSADGTVLLVGSPYESSSATGIDGDQMNQSASQSGAAYLFKRVGTNWSQQHYIKPSNTAQDYYFGYTVDLAKNGLVAVVGSYPEASNATGINGDQSDTTMPNRGAAYVFTSAGAALSQRSYVKGPTLDPGGYFGYALSLSADGRILAVGTGVAVTGDSVYLY
ncbi:MAG TPA: FG-GAP repeat protein [Steroidobacteraceae bacterium]|nr:FG-GAP repeat protein [Steroidobacteraceae bacterium]